MPETIDTKQLEAVERRLDVPVNSEQPPEYRVDRGDRGEISPGLRYVEEARTYPTGAGTAYLDITWETGEHESIALPGASALVNETAGSYLEIPLEPVAGVELLARIPIERVGEGTTTVHAEERVTQAGAERSGGDQVDGDAMIYEARAAAGRDDGLALHAIAATVIVDAGDDVDAGEIQALLDRPIYLRYAGTPDQPID